MNNELEAKIADLYEQYQNGQISKQEMQKKIDLLVEASATPAHK